MPEKARSPLTADASGLSFLIQRQGEALPPEQLYRELALNGFEAGANTVWVDCHDEDETGRLLLRVTDNGHGMTEEKLRFHIKSLFCSGKQLGVNHGLGARVATLARNPAGVTWASRVRGDENMVMVVKDSSGIFALENWPLEEPDENGATTDDVVDPDEGFLCDELLKNRDGTAVILHGNGKEDTWTATSTIVSYLSRRWWTLPGEIKVWEDAAGGWRRVQGLNEFLERNSETRGEILAEVEGLNHLTIKWALLKEGVDSPWGIRRGQVGVLVDNELFEWSEQSYRMQQFGITSRSVQRRMVIVVELPLYADDNINGWRMNMGRDGIEREGGRNTIDWAAIGEAFVQKMPEEIQRLLVTEGSSRDYESILRKRFGPEWQQMIQPLPQGDNVEGSHDRQSDQLGNGPLIERKRKRKRHHRVPRLNVVRPESPEAPTNRRQPRDREEMDRLPSRVEPAHNFPTPEWQTKESFGGKAGRVASYNRVTNKVLIVQDHPFVLSVMRWAREDNRNLSETGIKQIVQREFELEVIAKILHVNVLRNDPNFTKSDIEESLLSDDALTTGLAGMNALLIRIQKSLRTLGR